MRAFGLSSCITNKESGMKDAKYCKRKSASGKNLIKRRRRGSDGKMRTVCVLPVGSKRKKK